MKIQARTFMLLVTVFLTHATWAANEPRFSHLVTFGDSLSDPGNVFVATGQQSNPPYSGIDPVTRIPTFPYSTGGHHYSNGQPWIEQLAREIGLNRQAGPALQIAGANNYAFGGAQACASSNPLDLAEQVDLFLASGGGVMLSDSLVVIFVGGNDVREDLATGATGAVIDCAVTTILGQVQRLADAGADKFLVANVADVGATPALQAIGEPAITAATTLSGLFNLFLDPQLAGLGTALGVQIERFDVAGALADAISDGPFTVTGQGCITPLVPPFRCANADDHLFWDGIHPTKAGHDALKEQALADLRSAAPPLVQ